MPLWLKRFNEQGFEKLRIKKQWGRPTLWTNQVEEFLKAKVIQGACCETDNRGLPIGRSTSYFEKSVWSSFWNINDLIYIKAIRTFLDFDPLTTPKK